MYDIVCFNGDFLPRHEVKISPFNRGIMYGDGCFETFRSYSGKFLSLKSHYKRLQSALEYLLINQPFEFSEFSGLIDELLIQNNVDQTDSAIRVQCWRQGERGYKLVGNPCDWTISVSSINSAQEKPVKLITSRTPVIPNKALDRKSKLSNVINYIKAAQEAIEKNADDGLMLTTEKVVSETTISNIFWSNNDVIFTPSLECDILQGVTRELLIERLELTPFILKTGKFTLQDLKNAEFAFTTNSLSELREVYSLDDAVYTLNSNTFKEIKAIFDKLKKDLLQS